MNKFRNICFVGMPTSGKSHIGRHIAKKRLMTFVDTDKIIINKYKKQILNNSYNKGFLKLEEDPITSLNLKTLDDNSDYLNNNYVFSPGGSAIYNDESINHFKSNLKCRVYYLHISFDEYKERVCDKLTERGVVSASIPYHNISVDSALKYIYEERLDLYYNNADSIINVEDKEGSFERVYEHINDDYNSNLFRNC